MIFLPTAFLPRCLRRFAPAQEGVTAVEFAFIAPVLLLFMMGLIEFSLIMLALNLMEGATVVSSRIGATGFVASGQSREQTILAAVTARTQALLDPARFTINTRVYQTFDAIGAPEPYTDTNSNGQWDSDEPYQDVNGNGQWDADMAASGYGGAGAVVVYRVEYPWEVITPLLREIIGTNGMFTLRAQAVTKNEPF